MATKTEMIIEANNRGLLKGERKAQFDEAVRRGIIKLPDVQTSTAPQVTAPQQPVQQPVTQQTQEEPSFIEKALGVGEVGLSMATGAIAEPLSGLVGMGELATGGDLESATRAIESTQQALTYDPKTASGQSMQQGLAETLAPVGEAITESGEFLGDVTREATGSPTLGGIAQSIPEAALTLIGSGMGGKIFAPKVHGKLSVTPKEALTQAAPEVSNLKAKASALYKEISDAGVNVGKNDFQNLGISLNNIARRSGFDKELTPKASKFLDRVGRDFDKKAIKLTDIDQLRKVAQEVAGSIDNRTDAAIGAKMIQRIDDFIENQAPIIAKKHGTNVAGKYKEARSLYSRVKKAELIDDAFNRAEISASGFERGITNEMRSLLKNKKKIKGFTKDEISAMKDIANSGGSIQKIYARLGNLGLGDGAQRTGLMALMASGAGGAIGGFAGAAIPAVIGTIAGKAAARMASKNANFAKDLVKSGKNGVQITEAYIKNVPRKMQKKEDLASLLLDPTVDISKVKEFAAKAKVNKELIKEAEFIANKIRAGQLKGAVTTSALASQNENER